MRIRFTETALDEVEDILSYVAQYNPAAAVKIAAAIAHAIARAAEWPGSSPVVYDKDVRAKLVGRFHYRVYYVARDEELIIRNVRSTRRLRPWEDTEHK